MVIYISKEIPTKPEEVKELIAIDVYDKKDFGPGMEIMIRRVTNSSAKVTKKEAIEIIDMLLDELRYAIDGLYIRTYHAFKLAKIHHDKPEHHWIAIDYFERVDYFWDIRIQFLAVDGFTSDTILYFIRYLKKWRRTKIYRIKKNSRYAETFWLPY